MHDPFSILGLSRGATADEITRAYRRLAMRWHPDRNPTREAEEQFKQVKSAYELLLDAERLAASEASDAAATDTESGATEPFALTLHIALEEAAAGCVKTLTLATERHCAKCGGRGEIEHRSSVVCAICKGIGRLRTGRSSAPCSGCGGLGYLRVSSCPACAGSGWTTSQRQIEVRVPAGMRPGERLRLAGQHQPRDGSAAADLFVSLAFQPHPLFVLDGKDLLCTVPVNLFRLLHGGSLDIPTLNGMQAITIEAYPAHGLEYSLPGLGYPGRHGRGAGAMRLQLQPVFPQRLASVERKLLLRLEKAMLDDLAAQAPELAAWEQKTRQAR